MQFIENHESCLPSDQILTHLVEFARQRNIDPNRLLRGTRLFYQDLDNPNRCISFKQLESVIENAAKLMPNGELSFLVGQNILVGKQDNAVQVLLNSTSLQTCIRTLLCYQFSLFPYYFVNQYHTRETTYFVLNPALSQSAQCVDQFFSEVVISMISSLLKWRFPHLRISVSLPYQQPSHIEQYHSAIEFELTFGSPLFCISLQNNQINQKQLGANPILRRIAQRKLIHQPRPIGIIQCIWQIVQRSPQISCEQTASQLNISTATLKRKLKAHNTSFKQIKDRHQQQMALFHITTLGHSNEKVAQALNFSDLTNFRRAFKRWTGKTPNEIRGLS